MMNIKYIEKTMQKERKMEDLGVELDSLSPKEMISILENLDEIDKIQKMYFIRVNDKPHTIIIDSYNTIYTRYNNTYVPLEDTPEGEEVFKVLAELL